MQNEAGELVQFDHHSPDVEQHRDEVYARYRAQAPLIWTDAHRGYWVVLDYEVGRAVLRDSNFTVDREGFERSGLQIPEVQSNPPLVPGDYDGDAHTRYRSLLTPLFSRAAVESRRESVAATVSSAIDHVIGKHAFDIVTDIGLPVSISTVLGYLGLPHAAGRRYLDAVEDGYITSEQLMSADAIAHMEKVSVETIPLIDAKRHSVGLEDDVLAHLVRQSDDQLSSAELLSVAMSVVLGGVRTTTALIGHLLWQVDHHPELRRRLIEDSALIRAAIEETLRYSSPAGGIARTARADAELAGHQIKAGDRLFLAIPSMNRCEYAFSHADLFDVGRPTRSHAAFGLGRHFCLGAWLARMEAEEVLGQMLERIPNYAIDWDAARLAPGQGATASWATLPATVDGLLGSVDA